MLDKLIQLFEDVSSRRGFVGRCSARVTALMVSICGLEHLAEAKQCICGYPTDCCCLCTPSSPSCITECKGLHYFGWWWVCGGGITSRCCFECFQYQSSCGGTCGICPGAYCSYSDGNLSDCSGASCQGF